MNLGDAAAVDDAVDVVVDAAAVVVAAAVFDTDTAMVDDHLE